ncbi:hypothetical protein CLV59_109146 [Chitinophaga dinghuensis]|uniref:Uncharacterized protein n=1 Tax=Chitinophaga dinghuensis TaxID=1539050 RepID=A0A327VM03_9BACT|nr:hypothetical protein [Chitinophaga dinghuensis]RAJ75532.1 hypothetical protein CLV59_109146 [Chitinophaga dinghuensis]
MSKQLIGQATAEQIEAWKNEHGKVYSYKVEGKVCYMRTVTRDIYSLAATKVSSSPAKFNETIINGIWLGGDESIRKEDRYYFGLSDFVEELMNKKKGELGEC